MPEPYPLQGRLISGSELDEWLRESLAATRQEVWICSAYIRSTAFLRLLEKRASHEQLLASVLVRWQAQDLLSSASDLELFPICRDRGINLFLKLDFHGKVYAVPPLGIGVGSTNATASGLGFGLQPNAEINTLVACSEQNLGLVQSQFSGATRITEQLYSQLRDELEDIKLSKAESIQWSSDVLSLLKTSMPPSSLLVDECFWTDGSWWSVQPREAPDRNADHDLQLLGVARSGVSQAHLQLALKRTKCFNWLVEQLRRAENRELYFGRLTAEFHTALLDDPGPRRSQVKTLLQNLLNWLELAELSEVKVDRPGYSQRIKLVQSA